jgi:hypothetical protein
MGPKSYQPTRTPERPPNSPDPSRRSGDPGLLASAPPGTPERLLGLGRPGSILSFRSNSQNFAFIRGYALEQPDRMKSLE